MIKYRPDIDGLRAVAVSSVIIFHYYPEFLPGGYVGVDVFFVISGFLITSIILNDIDLGRFSISKFYIHRICRIFPSFLAILFAGLSLGWFLLLPSEYELLGKHTLKSVQFSQNFNLMKESGYFDVSSELKPLLHIWSLSLEEQFYFIWPFLFLAFRKKRKWLSQITIILISISFFYNLKYVDTNLSKAFYSLKSRFWELGFGGLAAFSISSRFKISQEILSLIGLLLLSICFFTFGDIKTFPGWWATIPVLGTILLILNPHSKTSYFLSFKPLVFIGKISYPLYLWHWLLFSIVRINSPEIAMNFGRVHFIKIATLVIALIFSIITYKFIEKPVRGLRDSRPFMLSGTLVTLFLFLGLAGWLIVRNKGFPNRFEEKSKNDVLIQDPYDCKTQLPLKGIEWCLTTDKSQVNDVVIIGDSHGPSLSPGIISYYKKRSRNVLIIGTGDTLGLMGTGHKSIGDKYGVNDARTLDEGFKWILRSKPKTVLLISRGPFYFEGVGFGVDKSTRKLVDTNTNEEGNNKQLFIKSLDKTLKYLTEARIEIVFFFDNAELGFNPKDMCEERPTRLLSFQVLDPCAVEYRKFLERYLPYKKAMMKILSKYPAVKTFDPNEYLCDQKYCYGKRNEMNLYVDHNHISSIAALWLEKYFNF